MTIARLSFLALGLIACLFPGALLADRDQAVITLDLSFLSLGVRVQDLRFVNNGEIESIDVYDTVRSRNVRYVGPPKLTFFRETGIDEVGKPIRERVGEIVLRAEPRRQLLLLWEQPAGSSQYSVRSMDDDLNSFPIGSFRFVNLCPFPLELKIGDEQHGVDRGGAVIVAGNFNHGEHYQALMVSRVEGEYRQAYSSMLYFNRRARILYFILPRDDPSSGGVRLIGIPQSERHFQTDVR
jgi:hypothetical protein